MPALMKPRLSRKGKQLQLCYDLSQRVNVAKTYPRTAPNGSTIVVYGHGNGLRIIWRGGRPLKRRAAAKEHSKPKVNGTSADAVMLDLTDDEPSQAPAVVEEDVEFESEEEEQDESEPYPPVIQHLDLPLGTEILDMSFPRIPSVSPYRPAESIPPIFQEEIVLSVACTDSSVRVITLPLTPPSDARKATDRTKHKTPYGEQILRIEGQHGHQAIPGGISMTWTSRRSGASSDDVDMDESDTEDDEEDTPGSRRRIRAGKDGGEWDLLVASHSIEVTGLLHIFRIPLVLNDHHYSLSTDPVFPYQTQYLSSPATHVFFSSSQYPSRRHLQLLVVDSKGSARVYDPLAPSRARPRSARPDIIPEKKLGAWIAAFSTGFEIPKHYKVNHSNLAQRKRMLDAKWVSDGKSIITLLSDGEWGVWDVDGSAPGASRAATNKPLSTFALRGFVSGSEPKSTSSSLATSKAGGKGPSLALAPMTPNTRRTREETLFHGPPASNPNDTPRGGISVSSILNASSSQPEDSIVLWYGDEIYRIPHFQQFRARSTNASGSSGSLYGPGLTRVDGVTLYGEPITGIEQFAQAKGVAARMGVPRDVLVTGERRLLVLAHVSPDATGAGGNIFARELDAMDRSDKVDHDLLKHGELDIGGMDRMLDTMSGGAATGDTNTLRLGNGTTAMRRVGFAGLGSSR